MKKFWFVMMALMLAAGFGTVACGGDDDDDTGTDGDTDADTDTDTDTDTDADTDTDTDADCGAIDSACCSDGSCQDTDALCVQIDTNGTVMCMTSCEPDICTEEVEGVADAACFDVSQGNGLGTCYDTDDLGTEMATGNSCALESFNGYCCPSSLGGDGLGFGEEAGDAGVASMCNDVDMSELAQATSFDELINCGVGICLTSSLDTDVAWCGVPCAFDNTCDMLHHCLPLDASGAEGGYCDLIAAK